MTETSILPGSTPVAEPGMDMVPPGVGPDETETGDDRRKLMIIGAVVGLLVVAAAAYMLLHKGSSSSDQPFVPTSTHSAPTTSGSAAHNPSKGSHGGAAKGNGGTTQAKLPKKAHKPQVRDPFKALVTAPVTSDGGTTTTKVDAPSPTQSTSPVTVGPNPVQSPPTAPNPTQPPTTTTGHGKTSGPPLWVQLMKTHGDRALFRVGYSHHKFRSFNVQAPPPGSAQGTVFDKVFALIGIESGQVTLQIGDDTPFDLTKGVSHAV